MFVSTAHVAPRLGRVWISVPLAVALMKSVRRRRDALRVLGGAAGGTFGAGVFRCLALVATLIC